MLWHLNQPIGIVIFAAPQASLSLRSRFFGLRNPRSSLGLSAMNDQLWLLQRVVLHPTYRGAGIAAEFVRQACDLCPVPWIETLSAMGRVNPFFERAGFQKVGVIHKHHRRQHDEYAFSEPVYYVKKSHGDHDETGRRVLSLDSVP